MSESRYRPGTCQGCGQVRALGLCTRCKKGQLNLDDALRYAELDRKALRYAELDRKALRYAELDRKANGGKR